MESIDSSFSFEKFSLLLYLKFKSSFSQKGDNIKTTREQSGARITISDGSTPERIVTINGVVENVNKAFSMICKKFEDVI